MFISKLYSAVLLSVLVLSTTAFSVINRAEDVTIGGTHTGDGLHIPLLSLQTCLTSYSGTFYQVGLGACGHNNNNNQLVVAVGHDLYDNYP